MAKRKRIEMPTGAVSLDLETKSALTPPRSRMPIADVAGATAGQAALEEVARAMTAAEDEGRVVKRLPIAAIRTNHIARDRIALDAEDMESLKASLAERGQQTPIEVVRVGPESYGLISGKRRLEALRQLGEADVLALIKKPETSQDAYRAMVEENEIRAPLSFFERANIAVVTTRNGVYPDARTAVSALFAHAPRAKRSKILSFVTLCEALGDVLSFPTAIPEKLGLALVRLLEEDASAKANIVRALGKTRPQTAAEERVVLEAALQKPAAPKPASDALAPGLAWNAKPGRVVLTGPAVTDELLAELRDWMVSRAAR